MFFICIHNKDNFHHIFDKEGDKIVMKRKIITGLMSMVFMLSFCSCNNESVFQKNNTEIDSLNQDKPNITSGEFSEILRNNEYTIWYQTDVVAKDESPVIYVLYDDGTFISTSGGIISNHLSSSVSEFANERRSLDLFLTFTELSQKTDEEIREYVEKIWELANKYVQKDYESEQLLNLCKEKGYYAYGFYKIYNTDSEMSDQFSKAKFYAEMLADTTASDEISQITEALNTECESFWINKVLNEVDAIREWHESPSYKFNGDNYPSYYDWEDEYISKASEACDSIFKSSHDFGSQNNNRGTYALSVTSDNSGNNVIAERIYFSDNIDYIEFTYPIGNQEIYDAVYGGYQTSTSKKFVMRTSPAASYSLDSIKAKGILIDKRPDILLRSEKK